MNQRVCTYLKGFISNVILKYKQEYHSSKCEYTFKLYLIDNILIIDCDEIDAILEAKIARLVKEAFGLCLAQKYNHDVTYSIYETFVELPSYGTFIRVTINGKEFWLHSMLNEFFTKDSIETTGDNKIVAHLDYISGKVTI